MLRGSSSFSRFRRRSETLRVACGHTQSSPQSARSIVTKTRTPGQCPATPRSLNIRERVRRAVRHDSPDVVKQLLNELIDRIDVSPDKHAQPYFWVPDVKRPGPSLVRAASGHRFVPAHVTWRWRESNPRPLSLQQDFSGRSVRCLYSAPPVLHTRRCDGPSRCELSHPPPRPARTVSHLADASDRAGDEPGLTDPL